ncbi:TetR/AcrR family transcriptional regulator [Taibaiella soli]|uniref:TetR/AcrR family transcriptional regulator n=1 Tax=Taibaiella soli TaxID=1649169 RepID=A0A2W2BFD2_9BACT|nr:TetR/AcrR family transcriptional regulator [Taibaiella soli]PZF74929.1 TetR/AcrR family transcriptional regulator [Taibaiella soli]
MSKAEKTRQFIVEKTAPVFNKKGYAGTSLTDLTEATGLTKGSIYGNFTNKDEVALAVFDYNLQNLQNIISIEMSKRTGIREKLMTYVDVYEHYQNYPFQQGGCPILNTATEADDTHPELKKKALGAVMNWKNTIMRLIEKGQEEGEFSKDTDAEQMAFTIVATIEGCIMIHKLTGKVQHRNMILQTIEKMIQAL